MRLASLWAAAAVFTTHNRPQDRPQDRPQESAGPLAAGPGGSGWACVLLGQVWFCPVPVAVADRL